MAYTAQIGISTHLKKIINGPWYPGGLKQLLTYHEIKNKIIVSLFSPEDPSKTNLLSESPTIYDISVSEVTIPF